MESDTNKALQTEFDEILTCIKPLYLAWNNQNEKITIGNWIKVLTNAKLFSVENLHLRNLYVLALYENLRKNSLHDTFQHNPPNGELQPLPNDLKQIIDNLSVKAKLEDSYWLDTDICLQKINSNGFKLEKNTYSDDYEEDDTIDLMMPSHKEGQTMSPNHITIAHNSLLLDDNQYQQSPVDNDKWSMNDTIALPIDKSDGHANAYIALSESKSPTNSLHNNDVSAFITNNGRNNKFKDLDRKLKKNDRNFLSKIQEKEILLSNINGMESRLIQLQSAYHEDIVKMGNQHELEMQKLMSRKNLEMEALQTDFRVKLEQQDSQIELMRKHLSGCNQQIITNKDNYNKEVAKLKKQHKEQLDNQTKEYESKISHLCTDFQKQKEEVESVSQKKHQQMLKETEQYFENLKNEMGEKSKNTSKEILQLEKNLHEIRSAKSALEADYKHAVSKINQLHTDNRNLQDQLNAAKNSCSMLEKEKDDAMKSSKVDIKHLNEKLELLHSKHQKYVEDTESNYKVNTSKLEKELQESQSKLHEANRNYNAEIESLTKVMTSEKTQLTKNYEAEIEELRKEMKSSKINSETKIEELEKLLDLKQLELAQISKEAEVKEKMSSQSKKDIRQELEYTMERQLRKKQFEMDEIQAALQRELQDKTKEVSDLMKQLSRQKQDMEIKLTEIRKSSDKQISNMSDDFKEKLACKEQEKQGEISKIKMECNQLKEDFKLEWERKTQALKVELQIVKKELHDEKMRKEMEEEKLQSELHTKSIGWDEEKLKLKRSHQLNLEKELKKCSDELDRKHREQMAQVLEKTNDKLKEIEKEYEIRNLRNNRTIEDYKSTIASLRQENDSTVRNQEQQIDDIKKKHVDELEHLQKLLKGNLEGYKKKIQNQENVHKTELEKQRNNYIREKMELECRINGLLPLDCKKDFEETIASLRTQIKLLEERIQILEAELNQDFSSHQFSFNSTVNYELNSLVQGDDVGNSDSINNGPTKTSDDPDSFKFFDLNTDGNIDNILKK